jgi:uncharacterized protein (DUF427 family)
MLMQAVFHGRVIAESDDTTVVEGNHYFPADSLRQEYFAPTGTVSICPWKGKAQISKVVNDPAWARWAAQLAPTVAIEAIIAWLDAGQPDPNQAATNVRHVISGVINAAAG